MTAAALGGPRRYGLAAALELLGVALALLTIVLFRDCVIDDTYIGLRYADNLLRGDGLVYNVGERVEGITNLAFTVAVAGLGRAGIELLVAARFLGLCGAVVAVWLAPSIVMPADEERLQRAIARLLCLSNFAFVYLAWGGLETGAFAGLVTAAAFVQARSEMHYGSIAGLLGGLAFATRPEGALVVLVGIAIAAWRHGLRDAVRTPGGWIAAGIAIVVEGFRWQYYGAWVPNTARVKGLLSAGTPSDLPWYGTFGDDLVEALSQTGGAAVLLFVVIAVVAAKRPWPARLAAVTVAAFIGFEIYAGGDWMLGYRYLVPVVPLYLSLAVAGGALAVQRALPPTLTSRLVAGAAAIVVAGYSWSFALRFRQDINAYPQFVMTSRDMTTAARWLQQRYAPTTEITCWRIGALGYYSGLRVIDTNGLTDARVADTLADPKALDRYLSERAPRLAILRGRPGEPSPATETIHGATYRFVRSFPQGAFQTWRLYERAQPE